MDNLLDILEKDPEYVSFMMDGQLIPIEDYLAIKPDRFEKIKKFVNEGRLVIGPWYVLPDEVLISGEAHIRNWLMGERLARQFGKKMNIGYLPDSFGHPSQMPQILSGLGMKWMTFWRGATEEVEKNEFFWEAPDGSRILVNLMPKGYSTGADLPDDPMILAARLDHYIDDLAPMGNTDILYMSNGADHVEALPYLSKIIMNANTQMKKGRIIHTTLETYFNDLVPKLQKKNIKTLKGEMMGTHTAVLLGSTLSTRMYLKKANFECERLLENITEPIHSLAALQGYPYPKELILEAWRHLLQNMPHDSICGCSIDEVHRDMQYRYNQVYEICEALLDRCGIFYGGIGIRNLKSANAVAIFNHIGQDRSGPVTFTVDLEPILISQAEFNDPDVPLASDSKAVRETNIPNVFDRKIPVEIKAYDGNREIPCMLNSVTVYKGKLQFNQYTLSNLYCTLRCNITLLPENVPAMGYKSLSLVPVYDGQGQKEPLKNAVIENEFFLVSPLDDGSLLVLDKKTSVEYKGIGRLVDSGDCGDEYTYCPPMQDSFIFVDTASIWTEAVKNGGVSQVLTVTGLLHLPETMVETCLRRSGKLADCFFSTRITLYTGIRRIDMETELDNQSEYHRIRVLFPLGFKAETSVSAGAFSVDIRPVEKKIEKNWHEYFTTNPQKEFCDVSGEKYGITVANRGLPEYEVYNEERESVIAMTLLRCVGEIGKWKMWTRKEAGGPFVPTPEGQCKGKHRFEYSVIPHEDTWESSGSCFEARNFAQPLHPLPFIPSVEGKLPTEKSFISLPRGLVVSAFKPCEFEDGYILRFYNITTKPIKDAVEFKFPIRKVVLTNLGEEEREELKIENGKVTIDTRPYQVITLKLEV
jgi:alpha-mannosidase